MSDGFRLQGVRVLVVDDAAYVLDVVTDILARAGARVTAVGRAEEALDVLERERPHVLLSDLSMPDKGATGSSVRSGPCRRRAAAPRPPRRSRPTAAPSIARASCAPASRCTW
jgi:CheY-like chemotaxis protein